MRRAAASSVAAIGLLWPLPASLHRLVLATQEAGNVDGHITRPQRLLVGLGEPALPLAARDRRDGVDRRIVLLHRARQPPREAPGPGPGEARSRRRGVGGG